MSPGSGRQTEGTTLTLPPTTLARVRLLAQQHHVERLELFGSTARGEALPPDFDFMVTFQVLPPLEHGRAYLRLAQALDDSLGAPVDLLEEEAIGNPYFLKAIRHERILIYGQ